jgi:putative phosphoribosyl transferase
MNHPRTAAAIPAGRAQLAGDLTVPSGFHSTVLFAHGSGSSRNSPRNQRAARALQDAGIATLLFDLLTEEEETIDLETAELRFNIQLLAQRLLYATDWLLAQPQFDKAKLGYFGASTGAGAALVAASKQTAAVGAVVSRGGRPDLAGAALATVTAPTLLIVGGADRTVLELNREALAALTCEKRLEVVPRATHLFEEPGALDEVTRLARLWFETHLGQSKDDSYAA